MFLGRLTAARRIERAGAAFPLVLSAIDSSRADGCNWRFMGSTDAITSDLSQARVYSRAAWCSLRGIWRAQRA
eukprot:13530702-Alexandrium_andersonii.AAC.1